MKRPLRHRYEVLPTCAETRRLAPDARWEVTKDGTPITGLFRLKRDAVRAAVKIARDAWQDDRHEHGTLLIKGRNGKIQDERTYGDDPTTTKG